MHSYPRIMHAESIIFWGSKKLDNVLDQKRVKSVVGNIRVAYSQQLSAESEDVFNENPLAQYGEELGIRHIANVNYYFTIVKSPLSLLRPAKYSVHAPEIPSWHQMPSRGPGVSPTSTKSCQQTATHYING